MRCRSGPERSRALTALRSCDVLHAHGSLYLTTLLALLARRRGSSPVHHGTRRFRALRFPCPERLTAARLGVHRCSGRATQRKGRRHTTPACATGSPRASAMARSCSSRTASIRSRSTHGTPDERLGRAPAWACRPRKSWRCLSGATRRRRIWTPCCSMPSTAYRLVVCGARRTLAGDVLDLGAVPYASMPDVFAAADFLLHAATGRGLPGERPGGDGERTAGGVAVGQRLRRLGRPGRARRGRLARRPRTGRGQARGHSRASRRVRPPRHASLRCGTGAGTRRSIATSISSGSRGREKP